MGASKNLMCRLLLLNKYEPMNIFSADHFVSEIGRAHV